MAKFNKDRFLNQITDKVQSAIDKKVISEEDIESNDVARLHGFIQYELTELIEDRKFALDVLNDFNYDEKSSWESLEETFGKFKTLMDIALVNLWKFLESRGITEYSYYNKSNNGEDTKLLDVAREDDKFAPSSEEEGRVPGKSGEGEEEFRERFHGDENQNGEE